jgi:single-stranded DNA-specific DHH superfamily exonuclease
VSRKNKTMDLEKVRLEEIERDLPGTGRCTAAIMRVVAGLADGGHPPAAVLTALIVAIGTVADFQELETESREALIRAVKATLDNRKSLEQMGNDTPAGGVH